MFTGLVETMGEVVGLEAGENGARRFTVRAPFAAELREGDSVAVDGACLTAEPGDEVFIPKGSVHSVRNLHDGTTRWLYGYD